MIYYPGDMVMTVNSMMMCSDTYSLVLIVAVITYIIYVYMGASSITTHS